jgi:hypothetical protein
MIYKDYFWTELNYEKYSYVAPSGEILTHVTYDPASRVYRIEDKEFINLSCAKGFAIAVLKRLGKIPDPDTNDDYETTDQQEENHD